MLVELRGARSTQMSNMRMRAPVCGMILEVETIILFDGLIPGQAEVIPILNHDDIEARKEGATKVYSYSTSRSR